MSAYLERTLEWWLGLSEVWISRLAGRRKQVRRLA